MLFNSLSFLIFFPVVTTLYFLLPHKRRWPLLLSASCFFYMCFIPQYIFILAITITIDYFAALLIEKAEGQEKKRHYLVASIISTCLVLFVFKYFNFFNANFAKIAALFGLHYPIGLIHLILPIGLSFHTFQSLSYVIEVYRGRQRAESHFGIYSLYVMFYPQLVAGPIERPQNLLHQFYEKHCFDYTRVTNGLKLMAWGMFKKVVIADRLAVLVNQVYDNPTAQPGLILMMATVFFAFQIYCDFSGYSDIAIGSAQVMGFKLMNNFNLPYLSQSISEFWQRWHISLSTWFRDYLYIPLGGSRCSRGRWQFNLMVTFLVSGLWHGANWTYVLWGALNGFYLLFGVWTANARAIIRRKIRLNVSGVLMRCCRTIVTFSLICFSWIFFRAKDVGEGFYIVRHLFEGIPALLRKVLLTHSLSGLGQLSALPNDRGYYLTSFLVVLALIIIQIFKGNGSLRDILSRRPLAVRWVFYYALVGCIFLFGVFNNTEFIYFQF
ncbi:MAG: MBOAT family O-acyltransferase [Candidatus Omnitrophota bacterium]